MSRPSLPLLYTRIIMSSVIIQSTHNTGPNILIFYSLLLAFINRDQVVMMH